MPHTCGYFPERSARNVVLDPATPDLRQVYGAALENGFRRAGGQVYRPHCAHCRACIPCRVPVATFRPDRAQRRCARRNADLELRDMPASFDAERFALYQRYVQSRHPGGGMDDTSREDFAHFIAADWSPTMFLEARADGRLVAVAVTDVTAAGLSAVYTFFDPAESARGLGTFMILSQIELARRWHLAHVYLGFWIAGHPKMDYKQRFQPLEIRVDDTWQALPRGPATDAAARAQATPGL